MVIGILLLDTVLIDNMHRAIGKAAKTAKKLAKEAKKEAKQLERAAKEAPPAIAEKLEKKAAVDSQLASEFKKASECTSKDCIKDSVKEVKEIKRKEEKEVEI